MSIEKIDLHEEVVCENEWLDQKEELQKNLAFKKRKRLSMSGGTSGDMVWERRRRRQTHRRRHSIHDCDDEDLNELRGFIELGFGFNEEDGQKLCNTLPALDLYFAVNRHMSPVSTPKQEPNDTSKQEPDDNCCHRPNRAASLPVRGPTCSIADSDSWKICNPGDDPTHVKMKLRHWAQAVACSVMQSH